ncbi:MAG: 4-hydroxyphenylacetate 3-monooxygenase, oxygenase component [Clostridia bacterium]|nr:4-hydroxyphenylacetate 3-monooxygenase, oxygenase component [Clostridia bacterium]
MGARTGAEYLARLDEETREVWIGGERVVTGVTKHPAFRNVTRSIAALYDMQHDPALKDELTYVSPTSGERVGVSFLQPRTREDLARRRRMMKIWADYSGGFLGRTPDYLNASLMAMAAAHDWFSEADPRFGENIRKYYEYVRENDLCLTHTLINPQANRAVGPSQQKDPFLAARIVKETDAGVVIRGARMLATLGPISDEIIVFPSTVLRGQPEDAPYAFAFALPSSAPGMKYICRETFDYGKSHFDHPLGSRFEEMDAVVVFDDVLVPWERIFLLRDTKKCNEVYAATDAVVHMAHQVAVKAVAKTEFLLGVVLLIIDTIGIGQFQHVQEKAAEVILALETMRAFLRAAEVDAQPNAWGVMTPAWAPLNAARNIYPKTYPRLVEIIQQLSASGLMALPSEADFRSPIGPTVERYLQARNADATERVKLFRLAWDVAASAFGGRQVLYERFFFGDPVRMWGALYESYDKAPYMERVRAFLSRSDEAE